MEHYIYLLSSAPTQHTDHKNHLLHFNTELARPLELEGDWHVCLKELLYPKLISTKSIYFFVYSNIVDFTLVGSKQYPIVRPVLLRNTEDDRWVVNYDRYENDIYVPVKESTVRHIELLIEPDLESEEDRLNFLPGEVIATLHFKRVK